MSATVRRFAASPTRLSSATWKAISELICKGNSKAAAEFAAVAGAASSLLNDQLFAENPLVVKNKGPRLRVYCLYGENAVSGDDKKEEPLTWHPTAAEWHAYLPCTPEEFDDTKRFVKGKSSKFTVYNIDQGLPDDEEETKENATSAETAVDWGAFKKL